MPREKYVHKLNTIEKIVIISVPIFVIGLAINAKYGIFPILSENQCHAFYIAIVTSLAAILAIVFAISLIAIQHAADKYTPNILERYKDDRRIKGMYLIFSLGIVFGVLALWFGWNYNGAIFAFGLLAFCLMCLYFQFRSVVDFVNPRKLIEKLGEETLNKLTGKLKRVALNFRENDHIRRNCLDLKVIAIKSIERREDDICTESVNALKEIVEEYVKVLEEIMKTLSEESQKEEFVRDLQRLNLDIFLPMLREIGVTAARQRRGFVDGSGVMSAIESVYRGFGMVVATYESSEMERAMERYLVDESNRTIYNIGEVVTANKPDENDLAAVVKSLRYLYEEYVSNKGFEVQTEGIIYYIYRFSIKAAEHQYYWIITDTLQFYDESIRKRTEDIEIITLIISNSICMCAVGIKNLSQEQDRQFLRNWCFSVLNHFLENKDFHEYFDKAKEYCSDYKKEIGELKEQFEKFLKKSKGEKDG